MADGVTSSARPRRQRDLSNIPGFNHSRRSWTGNGMHFTMETATYASPGFSFRNNKNNGTSFNEFLQPSRDRTSRQRGGGGGLLSGGLLGGAMNLLNDVAGSHPRREQPRRRPEKNVYVVESDETDSDYTSSEDDLAYGSLPRSTTQQPKSVFGKLKDRILDHGRQRADSTAESNEHASQTHTHHPDPRNDRRRYRSESPEPPRTSRQQRPRVGDYEKTPDSSPERFTDVPRSTHNSLNSRTEREVLALQRAVEIERKRYLEAKQRFQQASQRSMIDAEHVQDLLNRVKVHGTLLASAQRKLQVAKEQQRWEANSRQNRAPPQRQPSPPRQAHYDSGSDDEDEYDDFVPWPHRGFGAFQTTSRSNIPFQESSRHSGAFDPFGGFRLFDRLFADSDSSFHAHGNVNGFHFSTGPRGPSFERAGFSNNRSSHGAERPRTHTRTHTTVPQPPLDTPRNPLRPTEAARLFANYNSRWNSLSATFPTIPYPTRTLLAPALHDPSTIPHALGHTWSTEQIMQANTALFFLLALGFTPTISNLGLVTFKRVSAADEDVRLLVAVLKKEKMRWHSDRLGRRNEEVADGGVNEALQRDERARAVFHAVCGLMEFALGREE